MKPRKIKTKLDKGAKPNCELYGWYDGKRTYIGIAHNISLGTLSGGKLYRLAKTIVKEFERE